MLKKIERAKDVQIFNLEKKLIQKSHAGKQHACNTFMFLCNAVNFMHVIISGITLDTRNTNQELQFEFISEENQHLQHKLATMLRMSNAKDWQIAQLEYKLRSQPMMLSPQSDYLENSKGIYTQCICATYRAMNLIAYYNHRTTMLCVHY